MNIKIEVFSKVEREQFKKLKKPHDIQSFLNGLKYDSAPGTSSPRIVMRDSKANCFEGALFGAAALRMSGHNPLIVDMIAENDDDHVIALFKENGYYGAIAKSNTTLLRFREPVYRTLRELVMSYFDFYCNISGEKTLRSYSNPVDLSRFDNRNWMITNENLDYIGDYLSTIKHHKILSTKQLHNLGRADGDLVDLCFSGAVADGVFKPKKR
ncbi:MAG: hypothetical protein ACLP05_09525 [Candidatus Kryptoniota bacterium]